MEDQLLSFPYSFFFHKVYILIFVLILYLIFIFTYFRHVSIKYLYMFPLKGVLVFAVLMKSRWRESAGRKTDTQNACCHSSLYIDSGCLESIQY